MKERTSRWLWWGTWGLWLILWGWHLATLGRVPDGLFHDEAYNALDALGIGKDGYWPAFLPGNFGREPLMVYVMAASLRLFGTSSIWAVRLPAALGWGLTFPALYWLLREMFPRRARLYWAFAAPLLLTSLWFAINAHYAIRTSWFVLLETLFFAALWRVWRRGSTRAAVLAGLFGGLAFYTYLANRLIPLILLPLLLFALWQRRERLRERVPLLALVVLVALGVMLPALVHFARYPEDFTTRTSQVALIMGEGRADAPNRILAILENGRRVVAMFFAHGDENPRNNIPGRPALTWFSFPLLLAGLLVALRRPNGRHLFLLAWLGVMLLPTWLTEYAPSFQRAVGALPPLAVLLAAGGVALWQEGAAALARVLARPRTRARGLAMWGAVLALLVVGEGVASLRAFGQWAAMPALYYAFDGGLTRVGQYLASLPGDAVVYLSPTRVQHPTLQFFLNAAPAPPQVRAFDGRSVLVARPGQDAIYTVIVHEDFRFELMAPWLWPDLELTPERTFTAPDGTPYAKVFRVPASARLRTPRFAADARWADHIRLLGYDPINCCTYRPGEIMYLQLWWEAVGETPLRAWTVFTHLLNAEGKQVSGKDCEPGCGTFPTNVWVPGERVVAEYQIPIPPDLPPGEYTLEVGLYDWRTGERLPLADGSGDAVVLGRVRVAR